MSNRYEVQLTDIALKNLMKYPKKDQKLIMIKIDESKLQDYLDYLHIQKVKKQTQKMFSLDEVKQQLSL